MKKKNTLVSKLTKAALLLAALVAPLTTAKAQLTQIFPITQVWSYDATTCHDGEGWQLPGYNDGGWLTGPGGFSGGENNVNIVPILNTTTLPPPGAPQSPAGHAMYFRTHFNVGSTNGLSLIMSNAIDDCAVIYLNGSNVLNLRVTTPDVCASFGGGAIGTLGGATEALLYEVHTFTPSDLRNVIVPGDNVLAVEVHQVNATSSDMVFGMILMSTTATPPPPVGPIAFTNGTGVITFDTAPPAPQWSTITGTGANTDIADATALDTFAKTNDATIITSALVSTAGNPPVLLNQGVYASDAGAQYIQTRPTGVGYTRIMATLTNLSGGTLNSVGIRYTLTVAAVITEQVPGQLVYYSTSGTPGSWVPIPELNDAVNDNVAGSYPKSADISLTSPWAVNTKLYFLWVDDNSSSTGSDTALEIDNVQFVTLTPTPPMFANATDPTNRTVVQCASTTLSAGFATGTPTPTYQWYRTNGTPRAIVGATSASYTIANMTSGDAGTYFVVAANGNPPNATSHVATVTYVVAPTFGVVSAVFTTNPTEIVVSFNRAVDPGTVDFNGFGYDVSPPLAGFASVVPDPSGTNLIVTMNQSRTPGVFYCLTLDGNLASACDANVHPALGPYPLALQEYLVQLHDGGWQYNESGLDPGTSWMNPGYDDQQAGWQTGVGVFDQKGGTNRVSIGGVLVDTQLTLSNVVNFPGGDIPTYYFRKHFTFPAGTAGATLTLRPFFDDAAIIYINGFQVGQIGFTNPITGPTAFTAYGTNLSVLSVGDANFDTLPYAQPGGYTNLPLNHVVTGDNVLAIELKQINGTSSDITMGLELTALIPGLGLNATTDRQFQQTDLTWCSGVLQYNTNLSRGTGWHDVPGPNNVGLATSPHTVIWHPGTGQGTANGTNTMFFRLRQ